MALRILVMDVTAYFSSGRDARKAFSQGREGFCLNFKFFYFPCSRREPDLSRHDSLATRLLQLATRVTLFL